MAIRIGMVCALGWCAATLAGCMTYLPYQQYGTAAVLPPQHVFPSQSAPIVGSSTPAIVSNGTVVVGSGSSAEVQTVSNTARNSPSLPDLGHIYGRTAQSDDRDRNPIIVIPGVLGSRLVDTQSGSVVWGQFGGNGINPASPWGARMIALPMRQGQRLGALTDYVKPAGTLDALDVQFLGRTFQINAYRDLLNALGVGGYREALGDPNDVNYGNQSYNSFQFAYDWRRDNVENARLLHRFILEKKAYVEGERKKKYGELPEPVRFDIVAHSMGGLVARYYLEYGDTDLPADGSAPAITWAGAANVERLVMIGTPNAGALDAVANLVHGETLSRFLPRYEAAILGTMPALYQLLPRARQNPVIAEGDRKGVDILDPRVWSQLRWGLLDPRQSHILAELLPEVADPNERLQIAYEHQAKCLARARAFHMALDTPTDPPQGTTIHLIAGDAHPTINQFRVDNRGALTATAIQPGDGRVTRSSALMDERQSAGIKWTPRLNSPIKWSSVNFLFADHLGLTSDPGFTDNVLFLLLEAPR